VTAFGEWSLYIIVVGLHQSPDKRIIKGRPLEVDFDRRINVYNQERPHE
jgi:hypothetical protein